MNRPFRGISVRIERWQEDDLDWSLNIDLPAVPQRGDYLELPPNDDGTRRLPAYVELVTWTMAEDDEQDVIVTVR